MACVEEVKKEGKKVRFVNGSKYEYKDGKLYRNHNEKGKHSKLMKKVPEETEEEERTTRKVRKRKQLQNNFLLY